MLGELDEQAIETLLGNEVIGRIGCYADGKLYVVPITYAYDGESIIGHSGEGMKIGIMRKNPEVCFEIDHMENLANWQSVIAWGTFEELKGNDAADAMEQLKKRVLPLITGSGNTPTHGAHPSMHLHATIYKIRLHQKTGRFEKR